MLGQKVDKNYLTEFYEEMVLIRQFENLLFKLFNPAWKNSVTAFIAAASFNSGGGSLFRNAL